MMRKTTRQSVQNQAIYKQSEFDKAYQNASYAEMENLFPLFYPDWGWDFPWFDFENGINVDKYPQSGGLKPKGQKPTIVFRCNCINLALYYTTNQMQVGEQQALTVRGLNASLCHGTDITWELSGGGSLSSNVGFSTIYTAPASNPDCLNNATITARCGDYSATIQIAITAISNQDAAIECHTEGPYSIYTSLVCAKKFRCDGSLGQITGSNCCYTDEWFPSLDGSVCCLNLTCATCFDLLAYDAQKEGITDIRTQPLKDAGCCPAILL